ncbi:MAG: sialate O-acetylesterase, partial [Proteobacteria bacterium]|nr:sialate O-acetylesterase [Pseudomonadota bacterium]
SWYPGLTPEQQLADPRVPLYWSGWGEFRALQAASAGSNVYFGPEVTFGRALADADQPAVLVKHAVGGTDLANYWYPGAVPGDASAGPGFATLAVTMEQAALELDAAGDPWRWAGFVWMQGESDSLDPTMANAYESNLQGLLDAVRELTSTPELPAAIGLIATESIWTHADAVRAAQRAVADGDPDVFTVETDDLQRNDVDAAHYDGVSMRVLGARFATALLERDDVPAGSDAPEAALAVSAGSTAYDFTGTCGWEFELAEAVTVTDIGNYGATYLGTSADVGIWDADGALVLRTNVPSWADAPATWRDAFWYVAIEPVTLPAGTYRIGVVSWSGDADQYLTDATGAFADDVGFTAGVYAEANWLTYPAASYVDGEGISFVGPSFLFTP